MRDRGGLLASGRRDNDDLVPPSGAHEHARGITAVADCIGELAVADDFLWRKLKPRAGT